MLIRDFMEGEETELRRVFMSSVHTLACGFYTQEQLDAWAPAAYDKQKWAARMNALRPFVATVDGRAAGYAALQASGYIDHFFVSGDCSRQGVGSALMRHVHGVAAKRGLLQLSAQVSRSAEAFFCQARFSCSRATDGRFEGRSNDELQNAQGTACRKLIRAELLLGSVCLRGRARARKLCC